MSTDVVNLAYLAVTNDKVDGLAVVCHIQPVADIGTVSVYRDLLIVKCSGDNQRDKLLREVIRAVVV